MEGSIEINWEGVKTIITLPYITGIEDSYGASLTEIGTLIYGAENRFVMDLGTQRRITLNCTRVNPANYNDSLSGWDNSDSWSNGKWITEFIKALDHWQNLMDPKGGFTLRLVSPDKELFPNITKNVFLAGSIMPKYSIQKMTFSLPLVVASMTGDRKIVDTATLTFYADIDNKKFTQTYPKNTTVPVPSIPANWQNLKPSYAFAYWKSSTGAIVYPGELRQWSEDATFTAVWQPPLDTFVYSSAGTFENVTIPTGAVRMMIYAVGGGGGCGGAYYDYDIESDGSFSKNNAYPGGAGGGGEMIIKSVNTKSATTIDITVGSGGAGGGSQADGSAGESSLVTIGSKIVEARGGDGGKGARPAYYKDVSGGQKYYPGGNGGTNPKSGSTDSNSSTPGVPGTATGGYEVTGGKWYGGAGGGASPLNHDFKGTTYTSRGGSGVTTTWEESGFNGSYGGGAGSYARARSGDPIPSGGSGFVAIVFFK